MRDVSQRLQANLAALDDAQLAEPPSMDLSGAKTVADQVALFAFHDSCHVGQMGYIRKASDTRRLRDERTEILA